MKINKKKKKKGGVGKTAIVVDVAGALNRYITDNKLNVRLLVIDANPQGNTTDTLLGKRDEFLAYL